MQNNEIGQIWPTQWNTHKFYKVILQGRSDWDEPEAQHDIILEGTGENAKLFFSEHLPGHNTVSRKRALEQFYIWFVIVFFKQNRNNIKTIIYIFDMVLNEII